MSHGALVALPPCGAKPKRWRCAATVSAFSDFISGTTTTPNQIEFINLIVQ